MRAPAFAARATSAATRSRAAAEMSGPTCVAGSRGSPHDRASVASASCSRNGSKSPEATITRRFAVQRCPANANAPWATSAAARGRSAPSHTTAALFPPSSAWSGTRRRAQISCAVQPASDEPERDTASTPGSLIRAAAVRWSPVTSPSRPSGSPASRASASVSSARRVAGGAGFHTTELPSARAGAIFPHGIAIGLFQGVTTTTRPTGTRRNADSEPHGSIPPEGIDAALRRSVAARRTSASPCVTGFPRSAASCRAIRSAPAPSRSARRDSGRRRFSSVVSRQCRPAKRAAATATATATAGSALNSSEFGG